MVVPTMEAAPSFAAAEEIDESAGNPAFRATFSRAACTAFSFAAFASCSSFARSIWTLASSGFSWLPAPACVSIAIPI